MFRVTVRALGVSPYALFLTESKKIRSLQGLQGPARAEATWKLFRKLSSSDLSGLTRRAAKTAHPKHRPRLPLTQFNKFVRTQFPKVKGDNVQRFQAIAKLWVKK